MLPCNSGFLNWEGEMQGEFGMPSIEPPFFVTLVCIKLYYFILNFYMKKILGICVLVAIGAAMIVSWQYFGLKQDNNSIEVPLVQTSTPVATGLTVFAPSVNATIASPFKITGIVNGDGWYGFEGQVGSVTVYDSVGTVLDIKPLTATSDWMTSTVRFEANIEFLTTATSGVLIFKNENASGEPARDKTVSMPVQFVSVGEVSKVKAYFVNNALDPNISCSQVFPIVRLVPKTEAVAKAAVLELLKGPTNPEKQSGYETALNAGVRINGITIVNGVATVDFDNALDANVAGSCRVGLIRAQIEKTLKQFPSVSSVVISVAGRTEDILQP